MKKELLVKTFKTTTGAAVYIFLVSQIMQNGEKLFGKVDNALTPFVVLLLFSLSAATVGGLVFGQTVLLFIENKKLEGIKAAVYSVMWLGFYTLLGLAILIIIK